MNPNWQQCDQHGTWYDPYLEEYCQECLDEYQDYMTDVKRDLLMEEEE